MLAVDRAKACERFRIIGVVQLLANAACLVARSFIQLVAAFEF